MPDRRVGLALEALEDGEALRELGARAGAVRCPAGIAASSCWSRRIVVDELALEARGALLDERVRERVGELRCARRGGVLDGDADDVARVDDVAFRALSSESRERARPRSARTSSATCGERSSAAALAAAVCLPPESRRTSRPLKVGSVTETGETRSCAVARYSFGAVRP